MSITDERLTNTTCVLWSMRHTANPVAIIPLRQHEDLVDSIFELHPNTVAVISPTIVCKNPLYKDFVMPEQAFDISLSMDMRAIIVFEAFTNTTE